MFDGPWGPQLVRREAVSPTPPGSPLLPAAATCPCARRPHAELNAWLAQHSAKRSVQRLNIQSVTTDPLQPQSLFDPHQQDGPAAGTPPCGSGFGDSDSTSCYQQLHSPQDSDQHQQSESWASSAAPASASAPGSHAGSGCCSWTPARHSARTASSGSRSALMRWVM